MHAIALNILKKILFIIFLVAPVGASANDASGIVKYNEGAFHEARSLFLTQSKKGDAYATFWLGVTQWETGSDFRRATPF
ncbi:hypothetical protein A1OW_04060 [Enterovibrio norvegicus]|uniref:Sel1 repeat-containing protein n=1 Tax=Enterovibrio norvegicus DSM 15893 TaxID=1121869 RepID=A0A1I5SN00_9GAMM|nr:hypothetical protein [Enterovibrio norvegicus]OEF56209.1 hypothetical protein A1OU_15675 [Enterovibrio norvegicus]OEF60129.1 hypothetical protein A1OW_04060 [Enterovibrio norvegicus]SFP71686.1 hypothetical protein SAMN03084138_02916 [Enterovibrio norvegicus DSM 15893]